MHRGSCMIQPLHQLFMCLEWDKKTAIINLYSIEGKDFVTETLLCLLWGRIWIFKQMPREISASKALHSL